MGYCISVDCDNFSFDNYKADEVLVAIKNGIIDGKITEERWIDFNVLLKAETVEEAFEELRFELYEKDNKYKIDCFSGEKLAGWELEVFQCIAPYIDDGYLEYIGEDGEKWRYIFKNGECREVYPSITYDMDVCNNELLEKLKKIVLENYDSVICGATSEWSQGNYDDVFSDGESCGASWLAYEIGCLLGMELEQPQEPKYSWA